MIPSRAVNIFSHPLSTRSSMDHPYSTTSSSICSMTSSIHSATSSFSSSPSSRAVPTLGTFRVPDISRLHLARQAFHSSTSLFLCAISSALTLPSSAASSSSNVRLYSRKFLRIARCCSLLNNVRGRGRHRNCLNRSRMCFSNSWPLKSHIAYPFSS